MTRNERSGVWTLGRVLLAAALLAGSGCSESGDGDRLTIRIADAAMVPGPPLIFGPPPLGTFTIDARLTIDDVTRNGS